MALASGLRLGPYEILAPLGAGGMGEVYRARDTRLGREVAVKVLPQHLSDNAEVRARFEREAKTVSSLNHPNICTLFDVGREGDTDYLVMELVEGETLNTRLARGPLPGPEVLRLGSQIADALDRAHRAGVIHRDLKPGNVMITKSGAKLMDFGLARATGLPVPTGSAMSMAALTQTPTVAQPLTTEGSIIGTFQYMAPEQLEGGEADARSDIWAFGCVLYEMATGRRAFEGRSQASLIAAILERDPPAIAEAAPGSGATAAAAPPEGLGWLVRNCLSKDPEERIQTAHDVKLQLQRLAQSAGYSGTGMAIAPPAAAAPLAAPRPHVGARIAWGIAALALAAALALFAWAWPRVNRPQNVFRFHADTDGPAIASAGWPRISPDGASLLFQANDTSGVLRAWLLPLDQTTAHPIVGTEGLQRAYWSPDGREIAFVADGKIQRLPIAGGSPTIVCPAPGGADLSWGAGMILLDGRVTDSLQVVPAGGGELRPATRVSRADHEVGTAWPSFLPDGRRFLFLATRSDMPAGNIRLGRIGSLDSKLLGQSDGRVEYAPGGWVLFVRGSALLAQKLDLGRSRLTGQPITITDDLTRGNSQGNFSVSRDGVLALMRNAGEGGNELHLANRQGVIDGKVLANGNIGDPHFSPDGSRVLYERRGSLGAPYGEVSVYDLARGTDTPLTFTGGWAVRSMWSPDGRRFAYTRVKPDGGAVLMIGSADGLGAPDSIVVPSGGAFLSQWAASGSRLTFYSADGKSFVVPAEASGRTIRPLHEGLQMTHPQISPDGRWVAGVEGTTDFNVFVESLEGPPGRWQISATRAGKPLWVKGGRELLYETEGRVMAVDIDTDSGLHPGTPHLLFALPLRSFSRDIASWSCDSSGERFVLVTSPRTRSGGRNIEVVTSFESLVNRK